jgi:3-isopropylmalate dehydrogenase
MLANDSFHIAVLAGDGIGPEVVAPALEILRKIEATTPGLKFRFSEAPAGAGHYRDTGKSMPESTVKLCRDADAILLGACGLPDVRYPDGTEIMPQVELRFIFDLYAGVRPACLVPGVPSPIVGADRNGIDLVLIRESTEGLFASMGKGVVTHDEARETLVITRKTSERLFEFSCRLAERRKARGRPGKLTCARPMCSKRTLSSARSSTNAPRAIPASRPSGFTWMPVRRCWCAGRGILTSW